MYRQGGAHVYFLFDFSRIRKDENLQFSFILKSIGIFPFKVIFNLSNVQVEVVSSLDCQESSRKSSVLTVKFLFGPTKRPCSQLPECMVCEENCLKCGCPSKDLEKEKKTSGNPLNLPG